MFPLVGIVALEQSQTLTLEVHTPELTKAANVDEEHVDTTGVVGEKFTAHAPLHVAPGP
jgi:hypothetical protein